MEKSPIRHAVEKLGRFFAAPSATPIGDVGALAEFLSGQAAFVGQTTLIDYLKTRMGTRYREIFRDDAFAPALTAARDGMYHCCLSDLTVWTTAVAMADRLPAERLTGIARHCRSCAAGLVSANMAAQGQESFAARLAGIDWGAASDPNQSFSESPAGLVRLAPVSKAFRDQDREIIANSVRFHWIDVRRQFRARLSADALAADLETLVASE